MSVGSKDSVSPLSRFEVGSEYVVPFGTLVERRCFSSFAVTRTSRGMLFETYTGYHVWTTPYVAGVGGDVVRVKSLHGWLSLLLDVAGKSELDRDALYPGLPDDAAMSYGEMLDAMLIITECNLLHPVTAFVDGDRSVECSRRYMEWLGKQSAALSEAMSGDAADDDAEMRGAALAVRDAEVRGVLGGMLPDVGDAVR